MACAEAVPSIRALSIARPDTPKTSLRTLASLMLAVSRSFRSRFRSAALAFHQLPAVAQEVPQLPQRGRRHEALRAADKRHEIGNPSRLLHNRFEARHSAGAAGAADDVLEAPLEPGIDGLPQYPGPLPPHMS